MTSPLVIRSNRGARLRTDEDMASRYLDFFSDPETWGALVEEGIRIEVTVLGAYVYVAADAPSGRLFEGPDSRRFSRITVAYPLTPEPLGPPVMPRKSSRRHLVRPGR